MKQIFDKVKDAQLSLKNLLMSAKADGGLTKDRYCRFLRMQYHLTKGVQSHFLHLAGHPETAKKRELRDFLVRFAREEEFHFEIAKSDLKELGQEVSTCPFDVQLWWLYFNRMIVERPFVRLGATCVLENISEGSSEVLDSLIKGSNFLTPKALKFLTIHRHGVDLPHGAQIFEVLENANLSEEQQKDVAHGIHVGSVFYMRFMKWVINGEEVS